MKWKMFLLSIQSVVRKQMEKGGRRKVKTSKCILYFLQDVNNSKNINQLNSLLYLFC